MEIPVSPRCGGRGPKNYSSWLSEPSKVLTNSCKTTQPRRPRTPINLLQNATLFALLVCPFEGWDSISNILAVCGLSGLTLYRKRKKKKKKKPREDHSAVTPPLKSSRAAGPQSARSVTAVLYNSYYVIS